MPNTPDPVTPEEKKPEEKEKPIGTEVHSKSFRQIIADGRKELTGEPGTPEPAKPEPSEEEKKKQEEAAKAAREREETAKAEAAKAEAEKQAELARKTAEETIRKQKEDEERKKAEAAKADEAKKREEALKPKWQTDPNAPKDKNGKPMPRTYEEVAEEGARIGEERAYARIKAEQEEKDRKLEAERKAAADQQEAAKKAQEQWEKRQQDILDADMTDLYKSNKLPKVVNEKDPNDQGILARKELLETGVRVNTERMKAGLPPITSIKIIYYEHYKPKKQPAGADAPIAGPSSPPPGKAGEPVYNFARDHKKSFRQILAEEKRKLLRQGKTVATTN